MAFDLHFQKTFTLGFECISFWPLQVLISEIGSETEVEHALASSSKHGSSNQWEGRASKIAKLEAQLKHSVKNSDSSRSSSPKNHPVRGSGDGSSRQGSLTTNTPNTLQGNKRI